MSRALSRNRKNAAEPADRPLDQRETHALEAALKTLREHLRALLADLPVHVQTASGLARELHIERTTCQRLVSAVTAPYPGPELVGQLPGSTGLRMILDAIARRSDSHIASLQPARDALSELDQTIRDLAGSRRRLLQRLESHKAPPRLATSDLLAREHLFNAAAAITGRWSGLWFAAHVYAPTRDPALLNQSRVHGLIGHHARTDAVPLTFHVFGEEPEEPEKPDQYRPLIASDPILRAFSSQPLPIVRSRTPGEHVVQTIETSPEQDQPAPIDLVFGMTGRMSHPATRPSQLEEVWALVNFPVRRMLFDVFLHRDLARACIPGLDHHLWRPDFATQVGERWQTRFASGPKLELLPTGLQGAESSAYPRYAELLQTLFNARQADPREFVGYRCEVSFPAWRTGYRMSFDFGQAPLRE